MKESTYGQGRNRQNVIISTTSIRERTQIGVPYLDQGTLSTLIGYGYLNGGTLFVYLVLCAQEIFCEAYALL